MKNMGWTNKQATMKSARWGRAQGPTEPLAAGSLATCSLLPRAHGQTSRRWGRPRLMYHTSITRTGGCQSTRHRRASSSEHDAAIVKVIMLGKEWELSPYKAASWSRVASPIHRLLHSGWHAHGNGSGRLRHGAASLPRSIDFYPS